MKQKKKVRRPKDRSATENLLIEAATQVFARYGFAGSTTRLIAQEAGVNLALIARYFGNKQGLLLSVIENIAATSHEDTIPYPPQKSLKEECLAYAEYHFSRMIEGIELIRIIVVQSITDSEFAKGLRDIEFLDSAEIHERIGKFMAPSSEASAEEKARQIIELIDRLVFGTAVARILVEGKTKEEAIAEMNQSLRTLFSVFS